MYCHSRLQCDLPWLSLKFRCKKRVNHPFCSTVPHLSSSNSKFQAFFLKLQSLKKNSYPKSIQKPRVSEGQFVTEALSLGELIREYTDDGFPEEAVKVFVKMLECGESLERFRFFPSLVKAFSELFDVKKLREIHLHLAKLGVLDEDVYVANSLLGGYWKCGEADDAIKLFEKMPKRDSISWNSMVSGFYRSGDYALSLKMFSQMIKEHGVTPNRVACMSALTSCSALGSLIHGREIHGFVVKNGLVDEFLVSGLMDLYVKCGDMKNAFGVFEGSFDREFIRVNTVIWNVIILGFVSNGYLSRALDLFMEMLETGLSPDSSTIVAVLVLCAELIDLEIGKQIHGLAISLKLINDVRVETALIEMYFKCKCTKSGSEIFRASPNRNKVMWGSLISNFSQSGFPIEALELFHNHQVEYGFSDAVILLAALRACSSLNLKAKGSEIHGLVVKSGFCRDVFIGGALVDVYVKCRDIESAQKVFNRLPGRDLISWNALISGYAQNGCLNEALKAFRNMQSEQIRPNSVTNACILSVCASLSAMNLCKEVHCYILRHGFGSNVLTNNALISTYAKCGDVDYSRIIFQRMPEKDEISWNSILLGLSMHNQADEIFILFKKMREAKVKPDHSTFTALLSACSHAGKVKEGFEFFRDMMNHNYDLVPQIEQYTCMVDLLGRAGDLKQAYDLILSMPCVPDNKIWGSLLAACKNHGDGELAEVVSDQILKLDPTNISYRVLLSNLYEDRGERNEVDKIRAEIRETGLKKNPGCSWIEVDNGVHSFVSSDRSHNQSVDIYDALESLTGQELNYASPNDDGIFPRFTEIFGMKNVGPGFMYKRPQEHGSQSLWAREPQEVERAVNGKLQIEPKETTAEMTAKILIRGKASMNDESEGKLCCNF